MRGPTRSLPESPDISGFTSAQRVVVAPHEPVRRPLGKGRRLANHTRSVLLAHSAVPTACVSIHSFSLKERTATWALSRLQRSRCLEWTSFTCWRIITFTSVDPQARHQSSATNRPSQSRPKGVVSVSKSVSKRCFKHRSWGSNSERHASGTFCYVSGTQ